MNSLSDSLTKLKQAQIDYGYTDSQMAHRIGCSRQLWQMTRAGKIPPGKKILTFFLTKDADSLAPTADNSTTPHQSAQNKISAHLPRWLRFLYFKLRFPRQSKVAQSLKSKSRGGKKDASTMPRLR
ncbi:hypothetical protein ES703_53434 [subsurface metagenome]